MSKWFMWYQKEDKGEWYQSLASERQNLVNQKRPPFTTILDADYSFDDDQAPEDQYKTSYRGPFYIDLDCNDPQEVIDQFKLLLKNLEEDHDVDLRQVALYLTGGRGFHLIFDPKMFNESPPSRGTPMLPLVYKEMANELYVDTLDLNIYSAKKGRMFREPNVKRTNGNFKVQITVDEAKEMTVETYKTLCSTPRALTAPLAPTFNPKLGLLYAKAEGKISAAIKSLGKRKSEAHVLKDGIPPTLSAVMNGENVDEKLGFQKIAMQLAIAANAAQLSEADFIASCEGLIENHQSDGNRYNTPIKRRNELKRMYNYMWGHPGYAFSVGGVRSLMADKSAADEMSTGMTAPEEQAEGETTFAISKGVRVNEKGIFKKTDDIGMVQACALGMSNPRQLIDIESGEVNGYEVDLCIGEKKLKPRVMHMDAFGSRAQFMKFTLSAGSCNVDLTDGQCGAIADIMRTRTEKSGQQVYNVKREGIDMVLLPNGNLDIVWADQYGVQSLYDDIFYRLTGSLTEDVQYRTDLRQAPMLEDTEATRKFFDNLFEINRIDMIARCLGYFSGCFISQPLRHLFNKFPFLHIYGPAGSGKSETTRLFARMHYYKTAPVFSSALDSTKFTYEEMTTCSGSMPFILDEYKPREMRKDIYEKSKGILRSNYNGDAIQKGSVTSHTGSSKLTLTRTLNRAPIVVIAEAMITQSAQLERCIVVPLNKEGKQGHSEAFAYCQDHQEVMSSLGRFCIDRARAINMPKLQETMRKNIAFVRGKVGDRADENDRPVYNMAVLITSLEFARSLFKRVFGDRYEFRFTQMVDSITITSRAMIPRVMSEPSKVLNDIAYLSRHGDINTKLNSGEDYAVAGTSVFIRLKNAYMKYLKAKRSTGDESLFDSYEAFYSGVLGHPAVLDAHCIGNPLKDSANTAVFEFDVVKLANDGVEDFAGK
jgi:hypothetical protein